MGLVAATARHADLAPLLMWYVHGLMGVSLLLGEYPGSPNYSGLVPVWPFRLLDHDHLHLLCGFAMMAQAVGDLHGS